MAAGPVACARGERAALAGVRAHQSERHPAALRPQHELPVAQAHQHGDRHRLHVRGAARGPRRLRAADHPQDRLLR